MVKEKSNQVLIDGSKIITEACVRSGADAFVGYPITPSNLFYRYSQKRFPLFMAGPDEISVLQWMTGMSAAGKFPVTATSFPGLALMVESLNMAYMMEMPMLLVLVQRLGPSTGSATTGAQGDLKFLNGIISGGYPMPVFCPSNYEEAWVLTNKAIHTAVELRTPVILLTSKEMVMTQRSFDLSDLPEIKKVERPTFSPKGTYKAYLADDSLVPPFIPLGNDDHQVRINSSTHDNEGLIRKGTPESLDNTRRLKKKMEKALPDMAFYSLDEEPFATDLIVTYGISTDAARDALKQLREADYKVSLLTINTLLPVPGEVLRILDRYEHITFVEENLSGLLREVIYGQMPRAGVRSVNKIGSMIDPSEIVAEVFKNHQE
ncbi:MAG: hypothetical protein DWQ02_06240 [Bacteroidetes bacterium]|nr:MAG: hypothetical protein DWQ02_06240 [Bacteroidota bacterium]